MFLSAESILSAPREKQDKCLSIPPVLGAKTHAEIKGQKSDRQAGYCTPQSEPYWRGK